MKYRKKPILIDAFQWFPEMGEVGGVEYIGFDRNNQYCGIKTSKGRVLVYAGDYIVTDEQGERYICKPDKFESEYEKVKGE